MGADDPLQGSVPSPAPPDALPPVAAPTILPVPPLGYVPVYRRLADTFGDGDALVWDATDNVAEPGAAGGGGSPLTVKEADGAPSVASVTEIQVEGATVTEVSAGVAKFTVAAGGGTSPVLATDAFVATAAQTTFTLTNAPLAAGVLFVARDGIVAKAADWSLTGSDVVFGTGLDAGVEVEVRYWRTAPDGTTPFPEGFVATAGQTDFPLTHSAAAALVVAANGVVQKATAWSITGGGATLSFVSGLEAGADVWIAYLY